MLRIPSLSPSAAADRMSPRASHRSFDRFWRIDRDVDEIFETRHRRKSIHRSRHPPLATQNQTTQLIRQLQDLFRAGTHSKSCLSANIHFIILLCSKCINSVYIYSNISIYIKVHILIENCHTNIHGRKNNMQFCDRYILYKYLHQ